MGIKKDMFSFLRSTAPGPPSGGKHELVGGFIALFSKGKGKKTNKQAPAFSNSKAFVTEKRVK